MTFRDNRGIGMDNKQHMVIFQPSARRGLVDEGTHLIEASRQLGVDIEALCGEKKVCGKCKVRIEEGFFENSASLPISHTPVSGRKKKTSFSLPTQKKEGFRLACVAKVQGDLLVFVPEEARAGKANCQQSGERHPHRLESRCETILCPGGAANF